MSPTVRRYRHRQGPSGTHEQEKTEADDEEQEGAAERQDRDLRDLDAVDRRWGRRSEAEAPGRPDTVRGGVKTVTVCPAATLSGMLAVPNCVLSTALPGVPPKLPKAPN
ncbi:hypothetical protein [Tsukamurella sp. USMM236]|uniref:hypothetical protein n=1 Tax=Tsukamurella sp. USMM236 TaxID=3081301 RepID=UPI003015D52A